MKKISTDEVLNRLSSEDPSERIEVIELFYDVRPDEEIIKHLCKCIEDEDKGVRNAAASILTIHGTEKVCEVLVPYVSSMDISIRNLAGEILLKNGSKAVKSLVEYIDKDSNDDKKFVIDILGLIGDRSASERIYEELKVATHDNVILACMEALGKLDAHIAISDIIKKYQANELFKPTAIEAFGQMDNDKARKFIMDYYPLEDVLTQYSMIESMAKIGDVNTLEFLIQRLEDCEKSLVVSVVGAIFKISERLSIQPKIEGRLKKSIICTIRDGEPEYKEYAIRLLGDYNEKEIVLELLKIFGDADEIEDLIRTKLFEYPELILKNLPELLNENGERSALLLQLLREILITSAEAFETVDDMEVMYLTNAISENLTNPDEEVRRNAIELLFVIDMEKALLFIETMLNDENIWNKIRLMEILEAVEDERADKALEVLSHDSESMISERANSILSNRNNS